jgi:hypothetical protein
MKGNMKRLENKPLTHLIPTQEVTLKLSVFVMLRIPFAYHGKLTKEDLAQMAADAVNSRRSNNAVQVYLNGHEQCYPPGSQDPKDAVCAFTDVDADRGSVQIIEVEERPKGPRLERLLASNPNN